MRAALPLLRGDGVLFASANAAGWRPEKFLACIEEAIREQGGRFCDAQLLSAAAAGFSGFAFRAGVSEDGLAANPAGALASRPASCRSISADKLAHLWP